MAAYSIIDLETTGGKFNEEAITEVAVYRFDGLQVTDMFTSLINPERTIHPFVQRLTGINSETISDAPKFFEVAKQIIQITENCVFVAHNVSFDYRVLKQAFKKLGYNFERDTLCTVEASRLIFPGLKSYSLGKLCRDLTIPIPRRHRADGDALATLRLFNTLLKNDKKGLLSQKKFRDT